MYCPGGRDACRAVRPHYRAPGVVAHRSTTTCGTRVRDVRESTRGGRRPVVARTAPRPPYRGRVNFICVRGALCTGYVCTWGLSDKENAFSILRSLASPRPPAPPRRRPGGPAARRTAAGGAPCGARRLGRSDTDLSFPPTGDLTFKRARPQAQLHALSTQTARHESETVCAACVEHRAWAYVRGVRTSGGPRGDGRCAIACGF